MKKFPGFFLVILFVLTSDLCSAQQSEDANIRKIEDSEREAILKADTTVLVNLLSADVVVQNPENSIIRYNQIMRRIREGRIDYSSLERIIENISFVENIAIVMGREIVTPKGVTSNAGKTVTRRFTNIWLKTDAGWKLRARQATIVSVQ